MKKMLYLSCHSILEFDELKLFHEMGVDVFSMGAYTTHDPRMLNPPRPALDFEDDERLVNLALSCTKERLSKEFVDEFDVIMVMHIPRWIRYNWDLFKGKIVIWRTIGQSTIDKEAILKEYRDKGMMIVRYSPKERNLPNYIGEDAIIRFYKDDDEFKDWTGKKKRVITVAQNITSRAPYLNYNTFLDATEGFDRSLFGMENESAGFISGGFLEYEQLKNELRTNRVFMFTGTHPASYTLGFMEPFMTGTPVVAVGHGLGNMKYPGCEDLYEVSDIIQNGINGFYSDDVATLRHYIKTLMEDENLAKEISQKGRETAIRFFGKDVIKEQWRKFFRGLGVI